MGKKSGWAIGLAVAALALTPTAARAEPMPLTIELNKLEAAGEACRAYIVLHNPSPDAYTSLKLDLVMFDDDGIVARRLAVEGAPLTAGKTSLKVFDIAGLACPSIGRILLNDVLACAGASGAYEGCLARIETSARGKTPFIK